MRHEEVSLLLADHAHERLSDDDAAAVNEHLSNCEECSEWLETCLLCADALRSRNRQEGGAAPQPERSVITDGADAARSIPYPDASIPLPESRWGTFGSLAAVLVVSIGLSGWLYLQNRDLQAQLDATSNWSGPVHVLVLGGADRGGAAVPELRLEPGQPEALLAIQLLLPAELASGAEIEHPNSNRLRPAGWFLDRRRAVSASLGPRYRLRRRNTCGACARAASARCGHVSGRRQREKGPQRIDPGRDRGFHV